MPAPTYARGTEVRVAKSRAEIEHLVTKYGATAFGSAWQADKAVIQFEADGRRVRFVLPVPSLTDHRFDKDGRGSLRSPEKRKEAWEQASREVWRSLALVVKAKLEAVASKITTFEDDFLAHIVLPDGATVAEHIRPAIAAIYRSGKMQPMLPDYSGRSQ